MAPFSSIIKTYYSTDGALLWRAASNMPVCYHSGIDALNLYVCVCVCVCVWRKGGGGDSATVYMCTQQQQLDCKIKIAINLSSKSHNLITEPGVYHDTQKIYDLLTDLFQVNCIPPHNNIRQRESEVFPCDVRKVEIKLPTSVLHDD